MANRNPTRSDSCHFDGRAEITSRSRSGARSARNLDAIEHAHMLSSRSERSLASSCVVNALMLRGDRTSGHRWSCYYADRRGGATPPQGPTQALRWVTIFQSDGRRSPSHTDRLGRPRWHERSAVRADYSGFRSFLRWSRGGLRGRRMGHRDDASRWPLRSNNSSRPHRVLFGFFQLQPVVFGAPAPDVIHGQGDTSLHRLPHFHEPSGTSDDCTTPASTPTAYLALATRIRMPAT